MVTVFGVMMGVSLRATTFLADRRPKGKRPVVVSHVPLVAAGSAAG
jgi:hypothetical protein